MSDQSTDTCGFGPVEEFVCSAIHDPAELAVLEQQLKRPQSIKESSAAQSKETGEVPTNERPQVPDIT